MGQPTQKPKNIEVQFGHSQNGVIGNFKGPAKRSAFGDLSNTVAGTTANRNVSAIDHGKQAVIAAKTAVKMAPNHENKENAIKNGISKDAFLRPAQRRPSNGLKSSAAPGFPAQPVTKPHGAKKVTSVYNDVQQVKSLSRQYRSQPQLKQTAAPPLRRSHSKLPIQETNFNNPEEDIDDAPYEDCVEVMPREERAPVPAWMPMPGTVGPPIHADMEPLQPVPATASMPRVSSGISVPELEEHWDDDDDENIGYDEAGYTTAHSYKSYGDNTTGATTLIAPKKTAKVQRELDIARLAVEEHRPQEDIDEEEWDVSMVAEYGEEIFEYMRELEVGDQRAPFPFPTRNADFCTQERMLPNPHYMETVQCEIQWSMRSILMDWLVQVHNRFALLPETLFLTVNYIDRFLSAKMVSLGKLQLVGATAIFVAAKYEEINCPSVQEIVFMVDGGYNVDEILKAERFMLSMLQFELGWPGPMSFLRRISKADDYDLETRTLAKYFLEVTIMDERFVGCAPSYLAAGSHCLARMILKKGDWVSSDPLYGQSVNNLKLKSLWTLPHIHYSGYTWAQLKPLVAMILDCCRSPQKHHAAVYEKYCDRRFKKSSIFVENELAKGFALPFTNAIPRHSMCSAMDDQSANIRFPPTENSGVLIPTES